MLPDWCIQVLKGIVGQCLFQLSVMYALVFHVDAVFHIPADSSEHRTIIFNTFVLMQLFNQASQRAVPVSHIGG